MIVTDNYSHIILADITEMVASAKARNIKRYSVTEHVSQFRKLRESIAFGSVHNKGRIFEDLEAYRNEFSKVDGSKSSGMEVRMGIEVDFSTRYEKEVGEYVNQEEWDVLLCSVHELEDGSEIEKTRAKPLEPTEARSLWREYLVLEQTALESDFVPFSVLTHPVRMSKGTDYVPDEVDDLLLDLAKTARGRNKALELNGSDLGYAPQLVRRLAKACSRAGCKVSLGSDAHYPKDVFRNMTDAMALVEEFELQLA
ncbi:MAG: PHP domain-containing protein [Nitrososphaerales archaeon]